MICSKKSGSVYIDPLFRDSTQSAGIHYIYGKFGA